MTGYLQRLAARLVEPRATIRPRVASRFEAQASFVPAPGELATEAQADPARAGQRPPARAASPALPEATQPPAAHAASHDERLSSPRAGRAQREPIGLVSAGVDSGSRPGRSAVMPGTLSASPQSGEPALSYALGVPMQRTAVDSRAHSPLQLSDAPQAATVPIQMPAGGDLPARPAPASTAPPIQAVSMRVTADEAVSARDASLRPGSPDRILATPAWPPQPIAPRRRQLQPDTHNAAPTVVEVTIGTVEVRGPAAAAAPAPRAHTAVRAGATPRLSLQSYLSRRSEGGR